MRLQLHGDDSIARCELYGRDGHCRVPSGPDNQRPPAAGSVAVERLRHERPRVEAHDRGAEGCARAQRRAGCLWTMRTPGTSRVRSKGVLVSSLSASTAVSGRLGGLSGVWGPHCMPVRHMRIRQKRNANFVE